MKVHSKAPNIAKNGHSPDSEALRRRLEEIKDLTGCPLAFVIQSRCEEPDCLNQGLHLSEQFSLDGETCNLLKELKEGGELFLSRYLEKQLEAGEMNGKARDIPKPIIETKPRLRCVL